MDTTETNMTLQEAIVARHSVRQYIEKPIEAEKIQQLQTLIDECNREGGLHIQLVTEEPNAFAGGMAKYGKFRGVRNYIAMICKKGDDVKLGYYGEKVILLAQTLGLNTCWVDARSLGPGAGSRALLPLRPAGVPFSVSAVFYRGKTQAADKDQHTNSERLVPAAPRLAAVISSVIFAVISSAVALFTHTTNRV